MKRMIAAIACLFATAVLANQASAVCTAGDITPPKAISDLKLMSTNTSTDGKVSAIFCATAPLDNLSGVASYDLRYHQDKAISAFNWSSAAQANGEPTPSAAGVIDCFSIPDLLPGGNYSFAIRSYDGCGKISTMSNAIPVATLPAPPSRSIVVSWNGTNSPGTRVEYGTISRFDSRFSGYDQFMTVEANVNTAKIVIPKETKFYYSLRTTDGSSFSDWSNEINDFANLSYTLSQSEVTVSWLPIEGSSSYTVYYDTRSGYTSDNTYIGYANQACAGTSSTSCSFAIESGKTYYVNLRADNTDVLIDAGNEKPFTTP